VRKEFNPTLSQIEKISSSVSPGRLKKLPISLGGRKLHE